LLNDTKIQHGDKAIANLEVIPATIEQQPVLANLLELYVHDFSELLHIQVGTDGRFGYKDLPLYWREPGRYPFLIRVDGSWAGFVLVKKGSEVSADPAIWDLAEFFVLRGYRRSGVGTEAAHKVWKQFPGRWEVRIMQKNDSARNFWQQAVHNFVGQAIQPVPVEKNGKRWNLFSFESPRAIQPL
jgi:predicted acetyltransferase